MQALPFSFCRQSSKYHFYFSVPHNNTITSQMSKVNLLLIRPENAGFRGELVFWTTTNLLSLTLCDTKRPSNSWRCCAKWSGGNDLRRRADRSAGSEVRSGHFLILLQQLRQCEDCKRDNPKEGREQQDLPFVHVITPFSLFETA